MSESRIELTKGYFAIVDQEDFERLSQYNWYIIPQDTSIYAARAAYNQDTKKQTNIRMHREILGLSSRHPFIDHINGNGLDNRKQNLRIVSRSQNRMNSRKHKGVSKFKGVYKAKDKWRASIQKDCELILLGLFKTEEEAAKAYDKKAMELFSEYACLNFPESKS